MSTILGATLVAADLLANKNAITKSTRNLPARWNHAQRDVATSLRAAKREYATNYQTDRSRNYSPAPAPVIQRAPPSPDDIYLPVSLLMDKEIITRTSGKRLGYINTVYVDSTRLEVVSVYLRQGMTSLGATATDHILLSSLRQIGDVVLVHDESALLDPPADEAYGCYKLLGSEVQTEDGVTLGRVRDFVFNPDNGQLVSILYDALGIPSIPQALLSCYSLNWQDIVAVGPTKTIVRRGSDRRAVKENDGWITEYVSALVNALAGDDEEEQGVFAASEKYRTDPAYAAWYQQHAAEYERYYGQTLPKPIFETQPVQARQRRPPPPGPPRALPPPSSTPYAQAVQRQAPQQQQQQRRRPVPVGQQRGEPMMAGGAQRSMPPPGQPRQQQQQQPMRPPPSQQPPPSRGPPPREQQRQRAPPRAQPQPSPQE